MSKESNVKISNSRMVAKVWSIIKYQPGTTNCGSCLYSGSEWDEDKGVCKIIPDFILPINKHGVCREHSNFHFNNK